MLVLFSLLHTALLLPLFFHSAGGCVASGVCGGISGCQNPYYAQPVQPAYCDCAPTHACGRYGCYQVRNRVAAASVRTQQTSQGRGPSDALRFASGESGLVPTTSNDEKQPQIIDPNERFMQCCMEQNLPDACLEKCSFQTYTKDVLTRMYLRQDACPIQAAAELQFCAAQGQDHRECCVRNGVTTTIAGMKCLVLCDQTPGQIVQLDMSYMPCYDRFENMNSCFFYEMRKRR
uniref:Domain of unknown function DB domain-containing protein n=1 Tax=Plectus sambesii TaxID=2011161 RepID=A0A914VXR5_9BILA